MSILTLHDRLRRLAESRGVSMNRLVDDWATSALIQFDGETRFRALAASGRIERGLELLDRLNADGLA